MTTQPAPGEMYHHAVEALRQEAGGAQRVLSWGAVLGCLGRRFRDNGLPADENTKADMCWLLMQRRMLAPEPGGFSSAGQNPFQLHVTRYAQQVFAEMRPFPTDPDGYVASVARQLDLAGLVLSDVSRLYLYEAAECFASSRYLAAAVMAGCVCESELALTAEVMLTKTGIQWTAAQKTDLESWRVGERREAILTILRGHPLTSGTAESLEIHFGAITPVLALSRNRAGHPTGQVYPREHVFPHMMLLPGTIQFCTALRKEMEPWP